MVPMKKVGTAAKKKAIVYKYNREKDEIRNEPNEHDMIARHFIELEDSNVQLLVHHFLICASSVSICFCLYTYECM